MLRQNEIPSAEVFKTVFKTQRAFEAISADRLAVSLQQCLRYDAARTLRFGPVRQTVIRCT